MNEIIKPDGRMSFTPEEVADGRLERFVKVLIENQCQMRLWTDGYCYVVEYIEDITVSDGTFFTLIDNDHYIKSFNEPCDDEEED